MTSQDLTGMRALITGASSGLGSHFAQVLARAGASVTLAARRVDALEDACEIIRGSGGQARSTRMDVTNAESIRAALSQTSGGFDILVNNAGLSIARPALETGEEDWDTVIDTNLKGAFLVAQAVARDMADNGRGGTIVNIASILGIRAAGNVSSYAASKAGLVQLTKALALEWARHGIRVNALCPGYFETDLNRDFFASEAGKSLIKRIPQRRLGKPENLDGPLLLLCSDAGAYMTGTALAVDGGHLVSSL